MPKISLKAVDIINSKLAQANAITILLMGDCDGCDQLNDELRSHVLTAVSDLISDSNTLFNNEIEGNKHD